MIFCLVYCFFIFCNPAACKLSSPIPFLYWLHMWSKVEGQNVRLHIQMPFRIMNPYTYDSFTFRTHFVSEPLTLDHLYRSFLYAASASAAQSSVSCAATPAAEVRLIFTHKPRCFLVEGNHCFVLGVIILLCSFYCFVSDVKSTVLFVLYFIACYAPRNIILCLLCSTARSNMGFCQ